MMAMMLAIVDSIRLVLFTQAVTVPNTVIVVPPKHFSCSNGLKSIMLNSRMDYLVITFLHVVPFGPVNNNRYQGWNIRSPMNCLKLRR